MSVSDVDADFVVFDGEQVTGVSFKGRSDLTGDRGRGP
jgi:hypothetical protein